MVLRHLYRRPSAASLLWSAGIVASLAAAYGTGALLRRHQAEQRNEIVLSKERVPVPQDGPVQGAPDAPVTAVVFADFQCPLCRGSADALDRVVERSRGRFRVVFRHFPLTAIHKLAEPAARAAVAAEMQGKFWEYHDLAFRGQSDLKGPETLERWAAEAGLDVARWKADMESPAVRARVESEVETAKRLKVPGTPVAFINGRPFRPPFTVERLEKAIAEELPPTMASDAAVSRRSGS